MNIYIVLYYPYPFDTLSDMEAYKHAYLDKREAERCAGDLGGLVQEVELIHLSTDELLPAK